jgi:hypothetical protein
LAKDRAVQIPRRVDYQTEIRHRSWKIKETAKHELYLFAEINRKGVLYCSLARINLSCEVRVCADGCTIPVKTQPLNESRLSVLRTRLRIGVRVFSKSGASGYEQDNNPEHLHNFTSQDSRLERPERPFRRGVSFISPPRYSPI